MTGIVLLAESVGGNNGVVDLGRFVFHPGEEGGAKIKADFGIVARDALDATVAIQNPGSGVGSVALESDAFIPIMVRGGRILKFHAFEPGIFSGGLIKVPVNAD